MEWVFGDGTVVRLGGEVDGASVLAQRMRESLPTATVTEFTPVPSKSFELDPFNPLHMHEFALSHAEHERVQLVTAPEIDIPQAPSYEATTADGRMILY